MINAVLASFRNNYTHRKVTESGPGFPHALPSGSPKAAASSVTTTQLETRELASGPGGPRRHSPMAMFARFLQAPGLSPGAIQNRAVRSAHFSLPSFSP